MAKKNRGRTDGMIDCACVIHGSGYKWEYVEKLYNMLNRGLRNRMRLHVYTEADRPVPDHMVKHVLEDWRDQFHSGKHDIWHQKVDVKGNKIIPVNPYRFFPDPRIPITRWREGEFCADEIEYGRGDLEILEQSQQAAGVQYIPAFRQEDLERLLTSGVDQILYPNELQQLAGAIV